MSKWIVRRDRKYLTLSEIVNADGTEIPTITEMGFRDDELDIAHLVAAAPELLSLAYEVPCRCEREFKNPEKVIAQCERCRVITKAEGRS